MPTGRSVISCTLPWRRPSIVSVGIAFRLNVRDWPPGMLPGVKPVIVNSPAPLVSVALETLIVAVPRFWIVISWVALPSQGTFMRLAGLGLSTMSAS